jgi:hypothetical protein
VCWEPDPEAQGVLIATEIQPSTQAADSAEMTEIDQSKPRPTWLHAMMLCVPAVVGLVLAASLFEKPRPTFNSVSNVDPFPADGPGPDLTLNYDGVLVSPGVVRTGNGIRVTGVADGVFGPVDLSFDVVGGQATAPAGCETDAAAVIICRVSSDNGGDPVPFNIVIPVTGAGALTIKVGLPEREGQDRSDFNPANNTKTLIVSAR